MKGNGQIPRIPTPLLEYIVPVNPTVLAFEANSALLRPDAGATASRSPRDNYLRRLLSLGTVDDVWRRCRYNIPAIDKTYLGHIV